MSPIAYTATIIAVAVVLFVWNKLPVVVVAMLTALALWATGVLTLGQALGGFGDPAVIFIASLFVVSSGLEVTGVTAWAGQLLIRGAGEESRTRLLRPDDEPRCAADRADQRQRRGRRPAAGRRRHRGPAQAQLLAAADAAGLRRACRLDAGADRHAGERARLGSRQATRGVGGFGFFEFALVGVPLLAGTMAIIVLFGQRLLPERNGATMPADFSRHAKTLVEQYGLASGVYQMRVRASSPYVGRGAVGDRSRALSRTAARRRPGGRNGQRRCAGRSWRKAITCCCAAMPRRPPRSRPRCISRFARRQRPARARRRCSTAARASPRSSSRRARA